MTLGPSVRFQPPARVNVGFKAEVRVARRLRELGVPTLHGVVVCGGGDRESERELDILALIGDCIWIVEVKSSQGHPPRWTADGFRIIGPAAIEKARRQNRRQVEAVARLLPGVATAGVIVFSERVRVEPPCADTATLDSLSAFVAARQGRDASPPTLEAWRRLCEVHRGGASQARARGDASAPRKNVVPPP